MKKISEELIVVELTEEQQIQVNEIADKLAVLIREGKEIDESIFGAVTGGLAGMLAGPALGNAICKALGITSGLLYNLLTSRMFTTAVAGYLGYKN